MIVTGPPPVQMDEYFTVNDLFTPGPGVAAEWIPVKKFASKGEIRIIKKSYCWACGRDGCASKTGPQDSRPACRMA